jgi:hypothetical protein
MTDCFAQLYGGLGNQLFTIANGYAHAKRHGYTLKLSEKPVGYRGTYWDSYLHAFRDAIGSPTSGPRWHEPHFHYAPIPAAARNLSGYYQSSRYFADFSSELRSLFKPTDEIRAKVYKSYLSLLSTENAVVMHIRRGDYLWKGNDAVHSILGPDYYERAVAEIKRRVPEAKILVFSDDLDWCRTQPYLADAVFVDEPNECAALYLMSHFRHYIMANSSFSWWAVWLGKKAETVIVPDRWFGAAGPQDWQDVYEEDWIRIPITKDSHAEPA